MTEVFLGDAFEFLRSLKTNSVDLVVSSPPYFMGKEYDSSSNVSDFVSAHGKLRKHLIRILKPNGSICWQVGHHVSNKVVIPLDAIVYQVFSRSTKLILRNRIIWTFGHGVHCRTRFSGRHETILWFTKGDGYHFDLDAVRIPQKYPGKRHYKGPHHGEPSGNPLGKNPGDVWEIPNVKARHVEKTEHPCQFPIALAQRLVRALCPEGGLVVDPYLGSGSTAIAALKEHRQFLGCDNNPKYVEMARTRIDELKAGTLQIRQFDLPVLKPSKSQAVARLPAEWLEGLQLRN